MKINASIIPFNQPYLSGNEIDEFKKVVKSTKLSGNGNFSKKVKDLLQKKYHFNELFLTTSCTSAIELCALAIDFKEGDEIIIPSYTFASTPSPFVRAGVKIIFADCDKEHPNLSLESIKSKITSNTKAIMVVHYGGYTNNIADIKKICVKHNFLLIEDAAQAIGSFYEDKALGTFGDFSVFSFHETKNITCGEGGMLIVNNQNYLPKIKEIYEYGTNRKAFLEGKVKNYEWVSLGASFMLSEINASFLYSQLLNVEQVTAKRKKIWETYFNALLPFKNKLEIGFPDLRNARFNYHNFFIVLDSKLTKQLFIDYMQINKVQCTSHYAPLHLSRFVKTNFASQEQLSNTERFNDCLVRLPLFYELSEENTLKIISLISKFFETH